MKKVISLILLCIMLLTSVVACKDEKDEMPEVTGNDEVTTGVDTTVTVTEPETEAPPAIVTFDLADFRIVYSNVIDMQPARDLRTAISKKTGVTLDVQRIKGEPSEHEIVVGESERAISQKVYGEKFDSFYNKYGIYVENGHFVLLGLDKLTREASIDYFVKNIIKDGASFSIPEKGLVGEEITHKSVRLPVREDESYLRVVSHNILLQSLKNDVQRAYDLKVAFKFYDADIVGMQEVDDLWHENAGLDDIMASLGYSMVPIKPTAEYAHLKDKDIRNPIYYKTDKFELVDCGYDRYNATEFGGGTESEYPSSSYTWACLKLKDSDKKVIFVSTHLVARISHTSATAAQLAKPANDYRQESAKQLVDAIVELEKKFNAPAISVGDYNNNYESGTYSVMTSKMYSARARCEKRVNMNYHTSGNSLGSPTGAGKAIDHVFYSKSGITAKYFETLISPYSYAYSDHVPVLMDFVLK